jgi:hypothetical protein
MTDLERNWPKICLIGLSPGMGYCSKILQNAVDYKNFDLILLKMSFYNKIYLNNIYIYINFII